MRETFLIRGVEEKRLDSGVTIVGDRILGEKDPRSLSEQEFLSSPDVLYHGAAREFNFSPDRDFDRYDTGSDQTHDYGWGFYTTDFKDQAENYSFERSRHLDRKEPLIYSFLPYEAVMLDVRDRGNPEENGVLPNFFVEAWLKYLRAYVDNKENFSGWNKFMQMMVENSIYGEILPALEGALRARKPIQIRGNWFNPDDMGIFDSGANGVIADVFADFMKSIGYDGMIYREGGEGEKRQPLTGYVFYNCRVLDTWAGWQRRDNSELKEQGVVE